MHKLKTMGKTALFISSFLWGMGYVAVELALQSGWHPVAILAVTGLIGAMVLIVFSKKRIFYKVLSKTTRYACVKRNL